MVRVDAELPGMVDRHLGVRPSLHQHMPLRIGGDPEMAGIAAAGCVDWRKAVEVGRDKIA